MKKDALEKVSKVFHYILAGVVLFWILLENVAVFSRYVLKVAFPWCEEVFVLIFVWLIFIGCAIAANEDKHIEITLLKDALHGKAKMAVQLMQNVLMFAFLAVLVIQTFTVIGIQFRSNQITAILRIPVWLSTLSMLVGSIGWGVILIIKSVFIVRDLIKGDKS